MDNRDSDIFVWLFIASWIILLALLFSGCKTQKVVTDQTQESHVKTEQLYTSVLGVSVDSTGVWIRNVNIIIYRYSKPDSAGKQHVEEIEKVVIDDKQQSTVQTTIKDTDSLTSKVDSVGLTETKIKESSDSLLSQLTKLGLVVFGLILVIWLIFRRAF